MKLRFGLLACVAGAALAGAIPAVSQPSPSMTAHFINVGQAHATLLEFSCGAMLIDAGAQDEDHEQALVDYLEKFFARRNDLSRTLDSILITHNHIDHTRALRRVAETFTIERYFDNGFTEGPGTGGPNGLKKEVASGKRKTLVRTILDEEVEKTDHAGLTDADIDPFACADRDPEIRILQGSFLDANPGFPEGEFTNQNNHSLVTRVEFGTASFLFMGDLEVAGIELLVDHYDETAGGRRLLDADVIQVGHHGSHNATTAGLLTAVTPRVAVIPVGESTFGEDGGIFTTFAFGHPRKAAVDLLVQHMTRRRNPSKTVKVAEKAKQFRNQTVTRAIYATGWDGTVRVVARAANDITVFREH